MSYNIIPKIEALDFDLLVNRIKLHDFTKFFSDLYFQEKDVTLSGLYGSGSFQYVLFLGATLHRFDSNVRKLASAEEKNKAIIDSLMKFIEFNKNSIPEFLVIKNLFENNFDIISKFENLTYLHVQLILDFVEYKLRNINSWSPARKIPIGLHNPKEYHVTTFEIKDDKG